jgi:arsenite methyltransferase
MRIIYMKADYGIQDFWIIASFGILGLLCIILSFIWVYTLVLSVVFIFLASAGYLASKVGKPLVQEDISRLACLKGLEYVLDVGTGQGLLAIGMAKHLKNGGHSFGVDIWSGNKASDFSLSKSVRNAQIEGVTDRISFLYSDARTLAFSDESLDMVVSNLLLNDLPKTGRRKALSEMCRVLKNGGKLIISDIATSKYINDLQDHGIKDVSLHRPSRLADILYLRQITFLIGTKAALAYLSKTTLRT